MNLVKLGLVGHQDFSFTHDSKLTHDEIKVLALATFLADNPEYNVNPFEAKVLGVDTRGSQTTAIVAVRAWPVAVSAGRP